MQTYKEMRNNWMKDSAFKAVYVRIKREEMPMLDEIQSVRKAAGLTQAQVAERMGSTAPVVSRPEDALISGKHSLSLATLRRYAAAVGKRLEVHFV